MVNLAERSVQPKKYFQSTQGPALIKKQLWMAASIFKVGSRILRVEEAVLQNFYHPLHLTIFNVLYRIRISPSKCILKQSRIMAG